MKIKKLLIFPIFLITLFLIILILLRPQKLTLNESPQAADLIVVLEGDYYIRLDKAFSLAAEGYSDNIYSPGLFLPENIEYVNTLISRNPDIGFISDKTGKNTHEEALLTKTFIDGKSVNSILLVTSDYHSRRAKLTFSMVIKDAEIISVPARIWTKPKYDYVYRTELIRIIGAAILYWPDLFK